MDVEHDHRLFDPLGSPLDRSLCVREGLDAALA
jgi:hypothetical protein